jgi:regulator of sirC expression with transglutaminase-like and TPR domain
MGDEVRRRAEAAGSGLPRLRTLAQYLGAERGFAGDSSDYHHPDNIHLHRALERRRGLPLTLSAIYLFVARRAGILCGAMALPGHVVVTLRGDGESLIVDPFHGGRQLSRRDCMQFLTQHGHAPDPAWLRDASDGVILLRQLRNLMNSYLSRGLSSRAREIRPVLEVLTRSQVRRNLSASSRGERPGPRRPGPGTS